MDVRSLGFRTDLAIARLKGSTVEDRGTHLVVRTPDSPDYFWGNYLLLAAPPVPGGAREVVDAFRTEFPDAGHVAIGVDGTGPIDVTELVEAGLEDQPGSVLTATTMAPGLAVDADLRPLEGDADWAARVDLLMTDTEYESALHRRYLESRTPVVRALSEEGHGRWWGAFDADGAMLSSLGVFAVGDGLARYQVVHTHPEHRRRGLAGALVRTAGRDALARDDVDRLVIVADPGADGERLYLACGFEHAERQTQLQRTPDGARS